MKQFFSLLVIILFSGNTYGQRILNQYNFNEGGYYVCLLEGPMAKERGIPICPVSEQNAIDTTSFFYTSDTVVLNRLKKEILLYQQPVENGTSSIYLCGYTFWFCVYKEGKLLLKLPANLECGYMNTCMGQLLYKSKTLKQYKKYFKPLTLQFTCFTSTHERTQYIESIKKDPSYVSYKVFVEKPDSNIYAIESIQLK